MTPLIRVAFRTLSAFSPKLAGRAAFRLFTTPLKIGRLSPTEKRLAARADAKLQGAEDISFNMQGKHIAAYRFGSKTHAHSKRIILVHGWMSGARYMLAMVDPLLALGHEVICFDLPAHGASQGKQTDLTECAGALDQLLSRIDGADTIIAHSFGGAVTAYTLTRLRPKALGKDGHIVLLASPNQLSEVTKGFSKAFGLNAKAQRVYETKLAAKIGASLDEMDGNLMYRAAGYPLRIVHCADDAEVSIEQSRRYLALGDKVRLTELSGLGHRRILYHSAALQALVNCV